MSKVLTRCVLLIGALAVALLGIPTRGRSLEAIAAEELGGAAERVVSGR